jgi:hypothetical protein
MRFTEGFNKMTRDEQENWLVKKLMDLYANEKHLRRLLAMVRGGQKVQLMLNEGSDQTGLKETV